MSLSDAHGNTGSSRIKACFIRAANKTRFIRRGTCATTRVRHGPCLAGPRIPPPGVGGTGADLDRLLRCLVLPCNRHDSTFPVFPHGASMTRQLTVISRAHRQKRLGARAASPEDRSRNGHARRRPDYWAQAASAPQNSSSPAHTRARHGSFSLSLSLPTLHPTSHNTTHRRNRHARRAS